MNILVIGGTRFFGIPMVEKLIENGHRVTIATRGNSSNPFGNRVATATMDRTNPDSVRNAIGGKRYELIGQIHIVEVIPVRLYSKLPSILHRQKIRKILFHTREKEHLSLTGKILP